MESLINHLRNKPSIKKVYFNDAGEWLFHPRASYSRVKTREELLNPKEPEKPELVVLPVAPEPIQKATETQHEEEEPVKPESKKGKGK